MDRRELHGKGAPSDDISIDIEFSTKDLVGEEPAAKPRIALALLMGVGIALALIGIVAAVAMSGDDGDAEQPETAKALEVSPVPTGTMIALPRTNPPPRVKDEKGARAPGAIRPSR